MRIVARPTWDAIDWATPLARAHARGALPRPLAPPHAPAPPAPPHAPAPPAPPAPHADFAGLCALLRAEPGAGRSETWDALARPDSGVVVTGQQPGCLGGPLLVLYKAATAVALARRLAHAHARPVVPLFWNAGDDDDFDEVARVGWLQPDARLDIVELPRQGHAGWVGDLAAALDLAAADAILAADTPARAAFVAGDAVDHGVWVATFLSRVFPDLAIVDGRSTALRRAAAPLFVRYLDASEAVAGAIAAQIECVRDRTWTPALSPSSLRAPLHLTPQRRRTKLTEDWAPLRAALATAPETVSPNVVLRALVQDALLPTWAHVVGPAELAYLVELRPARTLLGVPEPALVPRATATLVAEAMWPVLAEWDPAGWLHDPAMALATAARAEPAAELETPFATLTDLLQRLAVAAPARERLGRKLQALRDEIASARDDAARSAWLAAHPALRGLPNWVRPRGKAQERVLAGLWLAATTGATSADAFGRELVALADAHLDALEAGAAVHAVVAIGARA